MRRYFVTMGMFILWATAVPAVAHGAIRINEIAWMGTATNPNAEWIELANDSNSIVDVSGWVLEPVGKHSSITFKKGSSHLFPKGTHIASHGYLLLERTHDNNVPNMTADLIYTGSLSNGGETLTLTNPAGAVVDTVKGGKNWCAVGGNNKTKETAQRTATGWITATATPRAVNATTGEIPSCTSSSVAAQGATTTATTNIATSTNTTTTATTILGGTSTSTTTINQNTTTPSNTTSGTHTSTYSYGPPTSYGPVPVVFLDIGPDRAVVAGADTKFSARVFSKLGKRYASAVVHWAFGDGSEADSTSVFKSYRAPGTYLVTATAVEGLGSGEDDAIITVHNADARVSAVSTKGITIANDGATRLDLSFWELRAGTTTYTLPEGTEMLPHASVLFPKGITALPYTSDSALLYPNGKSAAHYGVIKRATKKLVAFVPVQSVQPVTTSISSNSMKGRVSAVYNAANTVAYENTTVIAPAVSAETKLAGAHYALAASSSTSETTISPRTRVAPLTEHSFFTSPFTISLFGVLVTAGTILVIL